MKNKKMKNKIVCLLLAAVMTFSLTACSGNTGTEEAADGNTGADNTAAGESADADGAIAVKYSVVYPATGIQADGAKVLGELIEEHSDGRMKMEFYPSSQLGDKVATFEGLATGTIEMSECAATDLSSYNSMWSVFALPYLWENGTQAVNTVMDPDVRAVLEADAEEHGFVIIGWTDIGSRSVLNNVRVTPGPEEMKGLKPRCMEDPILAGAVNAMGGIATPLAANEIYAGLQQGTIDGLDHTPSVVAANGWQELCKYYSLTEHFTIPDPVFVSKPWFDSLAPEDQEAVMQAGEAFSDQWNNEIWPQATEEGLKILEEDGVEIIEVDKSAFIEATQSVVDEFLEEATDEQKELYELLTETRKKY